MTGSTVEIEISRGSLTDDLQDGDYYVGGSTNIYLEINYSPSGLLGYIKVTHTPRVTKIGSIKHKGKPQEGLDEALKNCTYVIVYFSKSDWDYEKPLLIQFDGKDEYYYVGSPNYWAKDDNPSGIGLLKALYKQNCGQRSAHVMDICNKDESSYSCPSCNNKGIDVQSSDEKDYKKVTHSLSGGGTIETIRNGVHTIIPPPSHESVTVYWYPLIDGSPLLMYFSSDSVFMKRASKTSNSWEEVQNDAPTSEDPKILSLLQSIKKKPTGPSPGDIVGYVAEGLAPVGIGGLSIWKGPSILRSLLSVLKMLFLHLSAISSLLPLAKAYGHSI